MFSNVSDSSSGFTLALLSDTNSPWDQTPAILLRQPAYFFPLGKRAGPLPSTKSYLHSPDLCEPEGRRVGIRLIKFGEQKMRLAGRKRVELEPGALEASFMYFSLLLFPNSLSITFFFPLPLSFSNFFLGGGGLRSLAKGLRGKRSSP
jgi:hypothetical protein